MERGPHRRRSIARLLEGAVVGEQVVVTGWVKTSRFSKNVSFVHVFDGSTDKTVQVVLDEALALAYKAELGVGAAVRVQGEWAASPGGEQSVEIKAHEVQIVGASDPSTYPLQKKRTTLEHLRTIAHLRSRTNLHQAVVRARDAISWHIHRYFHEHGFRWIHTPIITGSDAEGAGELFEVRAGDKPEGFFGKRTFLTVSGQLEVECFAQSHTDVYTFGPTFRAENSNTARHAAEFWMIEPEMAFADLDDVIALAEDFVRTVTQRVMADLPGDFELFDKRCPECGAYRPKEACKECGFDGPGVVASLQAALAEPFARVTFHEAVAILQQVDRAWEYPVGPHESLQAEHERYLAEEHFGRPVFITNYPREQKAFYMRVDEGGETVSATDLLVPRIGEMIGGSQREERLDMLLEQMERHQVEQEELWWYLDLRRWGSTPHGGFGLGLERMVLWMTGVQNIRDVLPFPRTPGHAEF
ncbi:MAG: asparagine--tRNA ligase [Myxococcales bacterium]|nr:asparagine--tRNA ligase [Myxococcales bacterium]MCB9671412.1 asparagine--tRNA ligase [Alphaproteobacteria bacterium]